MTQIEIINRNLIALKLAQRVITHAERITENNLYDILHRVTMFEGWGRCRNIIDTKSDEYTCLKDGLLYLIKDEQVVSHVISSAQSSTLTSFYTPTNVATAITRFAIDAYKQLNGKDAYSMLEPSVGAGAFLGGAKPYDIKVNVCDKDPLTQWIVLAKIMCYHKMTGNKATFNDIIGKGYERFEVEYDSYDIIVSNMPFGDFKVSDPDFARIGEVERWSCNKIHNYYFIKSMHLLNDGGIMAFITTRGFLGSEKNRVFREEMLKHGRIISIVRLPDNMFKTVDVGSDLIVYQKSTKYTEKFIETDDTFEEGLGEEFYDRGHHLRDTVITLRKNQYGKRVYHYRYNGKDMAKDLSDYLDSHLQSLVKKRSNMATPKSAAPVAATVPCGSPQGVPTAAKKAPSAAKPVAANLPVPQGVFSLLAGSEQHAANLSCIATIMRHFYGNVCDSNRTEFLAAYMSAISTMSFNVGSETTFHDLCKKFYKDMNKEHAKFLATLERKDEHGKWVPADIFYRDIEEGADGDITAEQALAASLNKFGKVDLQYMLTASGMQRTELINALQSQLYFNPITGKYQEADRWLTGDVISKAEEARNCIDLYRNGERVEAERAVNALEAARPAPIKFEDIEAQFGARWIPTKYYEQFLNYIADLDGPVPFRKIEIDYVQATDEFVGEVYGVYRRDWKMGHHQCGDTIFWALKGNCPAFKTEDKDGKKVDDEGKRQQAMRIIELINQAWVDWVNRPQCAGIRKEIEDIYNTKYNNEVRPKYDGSFQTFPDLRLDNLGIPELYQSQKDAIWMLKKNGGGVCWHEVGTGKTLIMCVTAYEMKRIGLVKKPLIIGLKANIGQIADTYRKAYPNARVLFPGNKDFSKAGRTDLLNQIKNNDWDVIIMTHDQFGKIPAAKETEMRIIQEEIDGLNDVLDESGRGKGRFRGRALSGLQKRREKLIIQLQNMQHDTACGKDDVMDFSEMGIDHIFVDESHYFKNLPFATRNTRVAGIGNPVGSQRAFKLLTAIRDIQHRTGRDLGATFLSGTIVSNSLTELYIIFKYLRPRALAAQNIHSFDAWAAVFAKRKADFEVNIVGQIKVKERFASFVNLPELSKFLSQITDYRTSVMCGIDAPKEVQHFESAKPTPNQEEMLKKLLEFVNGGGKWSALGIQRERPANLDKALMLVATNVARQTALDPRCLDDAKTYGDENGCKVRRCAENIVKLYQQHDEHKATQFVFTDISTLDKSKWNMQQELRDILVDEYGIPDSEVQFINDATTDGKRMELFDRMNRGEVRVLIGSTQKLGTGVNAQERAVAVHHLDIPWRPSDLEQRNGRAIRKGNTVKEWANNEVQVFIYATERTLDAYKFNLLKSKQMFIEQLNNGTLGIRRIDDDVIGGEDNKAVSYAEFLSILSGNTDLLTKAKLDAKILAMEKERGQFYRDRNDAVRKIEQYEKDIEDAEQWIKCAKYDIIQAADVTETTVPVIKGYEKECTDMHNAGKSLVTACNKYMQSAYNVIGHCGSVDIAAYRFEPQFDDHIGDLRCYVVGKSGQYYEYHKCNGKPNAANFEAAAGFVNEVLGNIPACIDARQKGIDSKRAQLPSLRDFAKREWSGAEELTELKVQLENVKARINPSEKKEKAA